VLVDTSTAITAGTSRNITVNALDNGGNIAITYTGTVQLSIDGGVGPESPGSGLPNNYTFNSNDAGSHVFSGGLTPLKSANGRSLTVQGVAGPAVTAGTQSGINVAPSATVGLQVLIYGEYNAGGTGSGKSTIPLTFTAGSPFTVMVNAIDQYWNVTPSSNPATVTVGTTDPYATAPGSRPLSSGTTTFNAILVTAGVQTLTASGAGMPNTSSNITVKAGPANRMLVVLPGETQVQGSGKSGTPNNLLAGQTLLATVYGVDSYYNTDTTDNSDKIWTFLPNDPYAVKPVSQTLTSGATIFALVPVTAGSQVVKSTSAMTNPTYQTGSFTVNPDTATAASQRLQLILSGETAVPGLPPYGVTNGGKTGSPQDQYAGVSSTVTARLVDRFYNLIPVGCPMTTVNVHPNDPSAADSAVALTNGVGIATITYLTQNNAHSATTNPVRNQLGWTLTATDLGVNNYTTDISTYTAVWPGPVVKLRILTASQQASEGTTPSGPGKTNAASPGSGTAGVAFPVTIQAVDNYWNTNYGLGPQNLADIGDQVYVQTNDAYIQNDSTTSMINGRITFATLTPRTAQTNWTFSAVDVTSSTISSQTVSGVNVSAASGGPLHYQVLLPSELAAPGSGQYPAGGKTGAPAAQVAGQAISAVTVNLVDDFWNPIKSGPALPWVNLTAPQSVDQYAVLPSSKPMTNPGGTGYSAIFASTVSLPTAGSALSHQLQADSGGVYSAVTSAFFTVNPNSLATLQLLVPGESAAAGKPQNWSYAGDPAGKNGSPSAPFTAGTPFVATVNATDSYYNLISTNPTVYLTSDDPYGTPSNVSAAAKVLTNGATTFTVRLLSAQDQNAVAITHHLISTWTLTAYQSPDFLMAASTPPVNLQIILPGQTAVPGNVASLGVTGPITAATAGENYPITVRLTDAWYNAVGNNSGNTTIHLATTDLYAPSDVDQLINSGANNFTAPYATHKFQSALASGWMVTAATSAGVGYAGMTAGPVVVGPDTNTGGYHTHQFLALLPGETYTPGKTGLSGGRSGTPFVGTGLSIPIAGQNIPVTVMAVDRFYNQIFDSQNPAAQISAAPSLYPVYQVPAPNFTVNNGSYTVIAALQASTTTANFYVNQTSVQTYTYSAATTTVFAVNQGPATQLQLLIQGETAVPGKTAAPAGKTGTPNGGTSFTAGQFYSATVNATDSFFNLVPSAGAKVQMTVDDPYATQNNIQQNLTGGTTIFAIQFLTANATGWHVTVSTVSGMNLANAQSSLLPVVANAPAKIMVTVPGIMLVPGNTAANGILGTPLAQTAGTLWYATATITDNYYNPVGNTATGSVWFQTSDPFDVDGATNTLLNGTTNFAVKMYQAGTQTLNVNCDTLTCSYSSATVSGIPISSGTISRVLVILPGEFYQPGNPPASGGTGKTIPDNPGTWTAGQMQVVTVYATDAYWNQTSSAATVSLAASNDPNPLGVGTKNMVNGTTTFAVTLFKAVDYNGFSQALTATINGIAFNTFTTPNFTVFPDALPASPRFLRVLVNGESAAPGTAGLKSGSPIGTSSWDTHFVAGTTTTFRVDATDTWGNLISTNPTVNLVTDDPNAKPSSSINVPLTQGTTQFSWNWVTKRTSDFSGTTPPFTAATATASGFTSGFEHLVVDPDRTKTNLQILVLGENPNPGAGYWPSTTGGKTGAPQTFAAGQAIPITVRTVDDYWNLVEAPSAGDPNVYVQANDPHIINPLVNGTAITHNVGTVVQSISLATKNLSPGWVLVSSGSAGATQFGINSSSPVPVDASTLAALQILVPTETAVPGDVANHGKSGTPSTQVAGTPFTIPVNSIRAIDTYYNTVSTNGSVAISLSDGYGSLSTGTISLSGGQSASPFDVTLGVSTQTFSPQVIYVNGFNLPTSTSSAIPVNTGTPAHLQLIVPGETAIPGAPTGMSGSPQSISAGMTYTVTVNLVDSRFNKVAQSNQPTVHLSMSDMYATVSANDVSLSNMGQRTFGVVFQAANAAPGWQVSVSTSGGTVSVSSDTSNFIVVGATTTDHILLVLPGETLAPGSARGFLNSPAPATAGVPYVSTVTLTDRFYNTKVDVTPQIQMTTNDPYATPPGILGVSGPTPFSMIFHKAPGPWTISVSTIVGYVGPPVVSTTSDPVTVHAATPTKLQILVPGQTANSGQPPYDNGQNGGYTGQPSAPFTAGTPFDVTVNLVDSFFNQSEGLDTFVKLSASDPFANPIISSMPQQQTGPANSFPVGRTIFTNLYLVTRSTSGWQIFASTSTGDPYAMAVSTWLPVQSASAQKFLVLAPGEQSQEGNFGSSGKISPPNASFTVGTTYYVQVRAVDSYFNIVTATNPVVTLTSDDPFAASPSTASPSAMTNGTLTLPFMLKTAEVYPNGAKTTLLTASAPGFTLGTPYQSGGLVMAPTTYNNIQILVPGQAGLPGSATGKSTPSISTQTAGVGFQATVRAVDRYFNVTPVQPANIQMAGTDTNDNRPAEYQADPLLSIPFNTSGVNISTWTFVTANATGWTLTVSGPGVSDTSPNIPVKAGAARVLQIVLPGENAVAGLGTYNLGGSGRTGTAQAWKSGVSSNVIVNVVDKHFNIVPTQAVGIALQNNTDAFVAPQNISFSGTTTYAFTLLTATTSTSFSATWQSPPPPDPSSSTVVSSTFAVTANNPVKLQILVPGESALPGSPTGKSSVGISTEAAGVAFPVTVSAVDLNWNVVATAAQIRLTTNDPYAPAVQLQNLFGGTTVFQMTFAEANLGSAGWTITASTVAGTALTLAPSAPVPVSAGPATRLQILLPNQFAVPGNAAIKGEMNAASNAVAGQVYDVAVRLTDDYYNVESAGNVVSSPNMPGVRLVSTDPNDVESSYAGGNPKPLDSATGSATFGAILVTSGTWTFTATDTGGTGTSYISDTSTSVITVAGAPTKLVTLLPGQALYPGTQGGVSNAAAVQAAGSIFNATVYVTDAYSNPVSTGRNPISAVTSDLYDVDPGNFALTGGSVTITNISPYTAGLTSLMVTDNDATAPALTASVSTFTVVADAASRIQLVMPGENPVPGNINLVRGVNGTPNTVLAGANFYVTANLTDSFWNPVVTATSSIQVVSSDPNNASAGPWVGFGKDPVSVSITTGSYAFPMSLITANASGWTMTATDLSTHQAPEPPQFTSFTSSAVPVQANNSAGFQRNLVALVPGESLAPGTATGKSGPVSPYTVGNFLNVTVVETDKFFNLIKLPLANAATVQISIQGNADPYAIIPSPTLAINSLNGQATFSNMQLFKATTEQFVPTDQSVPPHSPPWIAFPSSVFTASPRPAANLLLLIPNETALPGSGAPGKTGAVADVVAGSSFSATVEIVDSFFNPVSTHTPESLRIITSDPYGTASATQTFVSVQAQGAFMVQMRTAGPQTATAIDTNLLDPTTTWTPSVSPSAGTFNVLPGPAMQLLIVVPGETYAPGSPTGKTESPLTQIAGSAFTITVYQTDAEFNQVPSTTTPNVLLTSNDAGALVNAPLNSSPLLPEGFINYTVTASSSQAGFVITASTTTGTPVGAQGIAAGHSSPIGVWPGPRHHLQFSNLPSTVTAGQTFGGCVTMYDQFQNVLSSGPNATVNPLVTLNFDAETSSNSPTTITDPIQNPSWLPGTTTFNLISDAGQLCLNNYFSLLAAGSRWLKAYDVSQSTQVMTELGWNSGGIVYSTRPYITVIPGDPAKFVVSPVDDVTQNAGSNSAFGNYQIQAQLSDAYDNYVPRGGIVVQLSTFNVSGATGTISFSVGASSASPPAPAWTAVTDSNGSVGKSISLFYYVSHIAGDSSQIIFSAVVGSNTISNTTGLIATTGGSPTQMAFITPPSQETAGQTYKNPTIFTLERRDDFNNATAVSPQTVTLDIPAAQVNVHSGRGFYNASRDFEFETLSGQAIPFGIPGLTFNPGVSQLQILYFDKMSSTPLEDGRTGAWTLRAYQGTDYNATSDRVSTSFIVNPAVTAQVGFHNPVRTLMAGLPLEPGGNPRLSNFNIELQDQFANPTATPAVVTVNLYSYRMASSTFDAYGFSASSATLPSVSPPGFTVSTTSVLITSGTWGTTFYYLDTTASENYSLPISSPMLAAWVQGTSWSTGTQRVSVLAGPIVQVGMVTAPSLLTAGATSQVFQFATKDLYMNNSPILYGDSGGPTVQFNLTSTSTGTVQFATPFSTSPYVAGASSTTIAVGQSTMTFYLIDTLAGSHQAKAATNLPTGWTSAVSTYTVQPAPATLLRFITPSRYLVAGTTIQYEPNYQVGTPTNTVITVQSSDPFGNTSPISSNTVIAFYINNATSTLPSNGARGGMDPTDLSSFANISGGGPNALSVPFTTNSTQVSAYYYDMTQGTHTMVAHDNSGILADVQVTHFISPAPAAYFTIEPLSNPVSPIPVNTLVPFGTFTARDQFGNPATGDPKNGQYYTGTMTFGTSGSTNTVTLVDANAPSIKVSTYTFTIADHGVYANLLISDSIQETLHVMATDYVTPVPPLVPGNNSFDSSEHVLRGWTNDIARTVPAHSLGDAQTAGIVVTPTDLSPVPATDPTYNAKYMALRGTNWQGKTSLLQGDGNLAITYLPVPMLRLTFSLLPPTYSSSTVISQVQIAKETVTGALGDTDVTQLELVYDANGDGVFEPEAALGQQPTVDQVIATTTFVSGVATFSNLNITISPSHPKNYFVAVRISTAPVTPLPANLGLQLLSPSQVTVNGLGVASNNFAIVTSTSPVIRQAATIHVQGQDIAAWWAPGTGPTPGLGQQSTVTQGAAAVGMLRLALWTDAFQGSIHQFRITRSGTGNDFDIVGINIYQDANGNGTLEPTLDTWISSGTTSSFVNQVTTVTLNQNLIVTPTTSYIFVTYDFSPAAVLASQGATIRGPSDIFPADGNMASFVQIYSSTITVMPSQDELDLARVNDSAGGFSVPAVAMQGNKNVPIMKMTLQARNPNPGGGVVNTVVLTHLRVDRGNPNNLNFARDVDAVHLFYDNNGNGNFDVGVDTEVTNSNKTFTFAQSPLTMAVDVSTTILHVLNASVFPPAPGRIDIDHEIMVYTGIDATSNLLTGVTRATENTTAATHALGTVVEGQAYLTIVDPTGQLDGQAIGAAARVYFLTYDLDYLAQTGPTVSLGAEIRSTTYFVVDDPKTVGNHSGNIGLPSVGGQSVSYISNILEYPDNVVMTSTDVPSSITGSSLQQGATNQVIMRFTLQADQARAGLLSMTLTRTGTSSDSDVSNVKIWPDMAGTGIFNVAVDSPPIGAGVFGVPAAGLAGINFDTNTFSTNLNDLTTGPLKIDTLARSLNDYFVTYDIATLANPQNTLGVSVTSATYINVSAPNTVSNAHMPEASELRTIIPSPQVLHVDKQYYFSNDTGSYPLPKLQQQIQSIDTDVTLDTAAGLPPSGLFVVDSEVLSYNGIIGNTLHNVGRCLSSSCDPTNPPAHSTFTFVNNIQVPNYIGMNYTQGNRNVALVKLTLYDETNYNIRWFALDIGRVVPGGLNGSDADLTSVKVYGGDPYVRDSLGNMGINNALMGSGVMQYGNAHIAMNDTSLPIPPGFVLISTTPRVFYIAADVNQSASANDVFALSVLTKDAFTIGALTPGDGIHSIDSADFPVETGANIVGATIDTMTVTFTDLLPTNVTEAQNNVPVAKLNVKASNNTVIWQGLTVQRTGQNPDDSDVVHVNLWKDINDNGIFDDGNPVPMSPLTSAIGPNDTSLQVSVSTSFPSGPGVLYIDNELIKFTSNDNVNTFKGLTRGFLGTTATSHVLGRTVYGVVNDTLVGDNLAKPGLVTSGTNNFSNSVATMTFVAPQTVPNANDKPTGVNYFVTYDINPFAPVYRDLNNNGVEDPGEAVTVGALISSTASFAVLTPKLVALANVPPLTTKTAGILNYPDAVLFTPDDTIAPASATQGDKDVPILKFKLNTAVAFTQLTALKISRIGQGSIQTQGSNDDIAQVKIYRDANFDGILEPAVDVLIGTGTFAQPDPDGTGAKTTVINLFKTETINPTGSTYFIAYDIATGATSNNAEGLTIQDPGWFSGSFIPAGVDTMRADNMPHNSHEVTVSPLLVRVTGTSIALGSVLQGTTNFPLMAITVTPSINQVIISTLTLTQTGTIQYSLGTPPNVVGDGDFSKLYVYLDTNNNGLLDPTDTLVGSLPWGPGAGQFMGGNAVIPLSTPVTFNTSGGTLLIAADVAAVDGSGASTQGHMAGIQLSSAVAISMQPVTALQDPANVYPVQSANVPIYNFETVQIATITMRPDLTSDTKSPLQGVYFPEAWVNRQDQIQADWILSPSSLPSNITVTYQVGVSASSSTALPPTLTGWVPITSPPPIMLTGLGLSDKSVYYFFVRTLTTINGLSLPPSPIKVGTVHVDVTKPQPPGGFLNLPTSAPSGVITVQWSPTPDTGPSGLFSYKLRQFVDGNPVPMEILQTSTASFTFGSGQSAGAPSLIAARAAKTAGIMGSLGTSSPLQFLNGETGTARGAGHFYRYQVQTVNGAGTASDWSPASSTIDTGLPSEIISAVSNYPNPVDTRKGGLEGRTFITYLLASDAQVDITIYDLLGYRVMAWSFPAGSQGGAQGANFVPPGGWDGTNESGQKVSKGGYLAQIKVGGSKGSTTVIRKIGVIH